MCNLSSYLAIYGYGSMLQVLDFTEVFWHSIYHKIPNKDLSLWIHTVHRLWIDSRESSTDSGNFLSVSEYVDTDYRDTARTFDSNSSAQFKNPSSSIFFTLKSWEVHRTAQSRPPSLPSSCFLAQSEQSYISPSSGSGSMTWIPRITRKIRTYMVVMHRLRSLRRSRMPNQHELIII